MINQTKIQTLIIKIYEQTGIQINEDDPLILDYIALNLLFNEFLSDFNETFNELENKMLQTSNSFNAQNKQLVRALVDDLYSKIEEGVQEKINVSQQHNNFIMKRINLLIILYCILTFAVLTILTLIIVFMLPL